MPGRTPGSIAISGFVDGDVTLGLPRYRLSALAGERHARWRACASPSCSTRGTGWSRSSAATRSSGHCGSG
ncbi:hypothetical protein NKG94_01110 [Micromonospora sp. M12]